MALGYTNSIEWHKKINGGYFETGDVGTLDKDNFLIFSGRDEDKINFNGKIFSKTDIEKKISSNLNLNVKILIKKKNDDQKIFLIHR